VKLEGLSVTETAKLIGLSESAVKIGVIVGSRRWKDARNAMKRDLAEVALTPIFWAKVALPLCLMIGSLWMSTRLARPGVRPGGSGWLIAAPVAAVWLAGACVLMTAPDDARLALVLGKTWRVCPFNIAMLAVPGFVAMFLALKGLTPTRIAVSGAAGGLPARSTARSRIACIARKWASRSGARGICLGCWYRR
jgi:hypothetical protein